MQMSLNYQINTLVFQDRRVYFVKYEHKHKCAH